MRDSHRSTRTKKSRPRRSTRLVLETLESRELLDGSGFLLTPLDPGVTLAQQQQVHLSIRVDGQEQVIPLRLGITASGKLPVHTGDNSGWVHLDSPTAYTFQLQDIFTTWAQPFSSNQVLSYKADATHPLTVEVNQYPTTDWGNLVLRNSDEIVIRYGARGNGIDANAASNNYLGDWIGNTGQALSSPPGPIQVSGNNSLPSALASTSTGTYTNADPSTSGSQADLDPAVAGPYATTRQQYNLGNQAFKPTDTAFASGVELAGEITAPTNLGAFSGPLPVIVLLHGRHVTLYDPSTNNVFLNWPPNGTNRLSIPSYQGYQYLEDNLASHGYVVVSVSANGINAFDNNTFDLGALARAQLMQRTYDILANLNTDGVIRTRPADPAHHPGTDLFTGTSTPFGTRFVGKLDLQNIGIMGHSRGGEGVVRSYALNQSLGSPYGIKAVLPLAPVDFNRTVINNVPLAVILPYDDGDVSDLQGVHFYDDALYNQAGDLAPKYTILVNGADHNFFNTIWSPGGFAGGGDDSGYAADLRLTQTQERAVGLDYMAGFFRTYVGNAQAPVATGFLPMLRGDVPPPASAQTSQIFIGYEAPNLPAYRRDVNTERVVADTITNTLGGAVHTSVLATGTGSGITTFDIVGATQLPLPGQSSARQPHETPSARSSAPGLNLLRLQWTNTLNAFYSNDVPAGSRDVSAYYALAFRASTVYNTPQDNRNKPNLTLDFSVTLVDGNGNTATVRADNFTRSLYYPFGPDTGNVVPRVFLNSVRIPLGAFAGVNLTDIRNIRFNFDQKAEGYVLLADLAFEDPSTIYAGPYVVSSSPADAVVGATSFHVSFNTAIDATTFDASAVQIADPDGVAVPVTSVVPTPNSDGTGFDVFFNPLTKLGVYTVTIGPNVQDTFGHAMDQNFNGVAGEVTDVFMTTLTVHGPRITGSNLPPNALPGEVGSARVTFNTSMDPTTFTPDKVTLKGPGGASVAITGVTPVDGSNNTQFDITFTPPTATGAYTLTVGPNIRDLFGNQMDQNDNFIPGETPGDQFVATFNIVHTYTATSEAAQNFDIFGTTGTQTVVFTSGSVTEDDDFGTINLPGSNTFTFYGVTYNRLFISSNGVITFGAGTSAIEPAGDSRFNPSLPYIAPYWTDLFKSGNEPMIVWKIVGNQLIIEWYRVTTFDGSPLMTFQTVLNLNTGAASGDILFNYQNVTGTGDGPEDIGVTVGVKAAGTGPTTLTTLLEDGSKGFSATGDSRVQTGKAVRLHFV
jgi:hypothetical protein